MKTQRTILSVCLLLCLLTFPAGAQIPKTITYQGSLTDAAGVPLNETVSMHFALFEGLSGGVSIWNEAHPNVEVENGIYSVMLGASSPLDLAFDKTYYLEISIGGGTPLAPRHALSSAPYALKAASVDGLTVKNGNVGVGMPDPPRKFSVWGSALLFNQNANNYGWQVYTIPGGIPDESFAGSLSFHENTAENYTGSHRMVIQPGGNVGIGTTAPSERLEVAGNTLIETTASNGQKTRFRFTGRVLSLQGGPEQNYPSFQIRDDQGQTALDIGWGSKLSKWIGLRVGNQHKLGIRGDAGELVSFWDEKYDNILLLGTDANWPDFLRLRPTRGSGVAITNNGDTIGVFVSAVDGRVGINNAEPQYRLDVSGVIRGTNVSPSDARWKEDIVPLDGSLERLAHLRSVSFRWKPPVEGAGFHPMGIEPVKSETVSGMEMGADAPPVQTRTSLPEERRQIGLIAQEVEAVFPEAVFTDENGYKSVAYDMLVAPLIDSVNGLKAENTMLRGELEELKARLSALEQQ